MHFNDDSNTFHLTCVWIKTYPLIEQTQAHSTVHPVSLFINLYCLAFERSCTNPIFSFIWL